MSHIQHHRGSGGTIHLAGGGAKEEGIPFFSQPELLEHCRRLAERRILFSVGGHSPGAADEMMMWHNDGSLQIPFLQIAWSRPEQWVIHEIIPGARPPWQSADLSEILSP